MPSLRVLAGGYREIQPWKRAVPACLRMHLRRHKVQISGTAGKANSAHSHVNRDENT